MPVVHWSASVFSTEGVLTSHGPSSKVSTTSLSLRKSSCLKCSNPKPGPPVVSICTTRETPTTSVPPLQATLGPGGGAGAGGGVGVACCAGAAPLAAGAAGVGAGPLAIGSCAKAEPAATSETAPAKIRPAAMRIVFPSDLSGLNAALCQRRAAASP